MTMLWKRLFIVAACAAVFAQAADNIATSVYYTDAIVIVSVQSGRGVDKILVQLQCNALYNNTPTELVFGPDTLNATSIAKLHTGMRANVRGTTTSNRTLLVSSFQLISQPSTSQAIRQAAPTGELKVLHIVTSWAGYAANSITAHTNALNGVGVLWNNCTKGLFKLSASSTVVGPVAMGAITPQCPNLATTTQWKQTAMALAKQQFAVDPSTFDVVSFSWPPAPPSGCWLGLAVTNCVGQGSGVPCYAEYWQSGAIKTPTQLHELGHTLGLGHSRVQGSSDEYSDSTSPMGYGVSVCYATPHLAKLTWLTFQFTLSLSNFPAGQAVERTLVPVTRGGANRVHSLRINAFDASDALGPVFMSYWIKEGPMQGGPYWTGNRTLIWRSNGAMTYPSPVTDTSFVGSMSNGDALEITSMKLLVRQTASNINGATLRMCRYVNTRGECPADMTPLSNPVIKTATLELSLFDAQRYGAGAFQKPTVSWTASDGPKCWVLADLTGWGLARMISSASIKVTCSSTWKNAECRWLFQSVNVRLYAKVNSAGDSLRVKIPDAFPWNYCDGLVCAGYRETLPPLIDNRTMSLQMCIGGQLPAPAAGTITDNRDFMPYGVLSTTARLGLQSRVSASQSNSVQSNNVNPPLQVVPSTQPATSEGPA